MKITSLEKIKTGQTCKILEIELEGEIKYRLLDMGITPNTKIKLTKKAPLGDPIQIEVRGYSLSIRKEIAQKIKVEVKEWYLH